MRGIYFDGSSASYREDLPMPVPGPKESLVRVLLTAVCNTDKEILKGYRPDFHGVMGHEFVGVVEASPRKELVGKRVVGELNAACGECVYCKTGRPTHCSSRRVLGMHDKDGCFAEYMTIDTALLHEVPEGLPTELAIYTEPLAAAYEILTQVELPKCTRGLCAGDGVCADYPIGILGDGRLAYCVAQMFHAEGYPVTVIGKHPEKLEAFAPYAGVTTERAAESCELLVEATGSESGLQQALSMVRKKGTIVLKSTFAGDTTLPMSQVAVNEITVVGSRCGPFVPALAALAGGKVQFPEITVFAPDRYEEAFAYRGFKAGIRFANR